ncbi:MAG: hypothetical protein WCT01_04515 [Candidatus Shapirobacteria bacterium]
MKHILVLSALSLIFLTACGTNTPTSLPISDSATPTSAPAAASKSLRELLGLGVAQKCTFATSTDDGQVLSGTIIIDKTKFKQIVTTTSKDAGQVTVNAVSDGDYFYSWNSQMPSQGIKFKSPTPGASDVAEVPQDANTNIDLDSKFNYNCSPVSVSASEFDLPSGVEFTDLQAMLDATKNGGFDLEDLKKMIPQDFDE